MTRILAPIAMGFTVLSASTLLVSAPARAESLGMSASSASSAASSAGSASLRGSSDSIRGSSHSSSGNDDEPVRQGEYRIRDVGPQAGHPGMLTLQLEPVDGARTGDAFLLDLPARALGDHPLTAGEVITANPQEYGLEFTRGTPRAPFYLVVAEAVERELATRPVRPSTTLN